MKFPTFVLLSLLLAAPAAFAADPAPPRTVQVTGTADVQVVPDRAELVLGIETKSDSLAAAARENDARVARVIAFLRDQGVPADRIQTDFIAIEPVYHERDSQRIDYFQAQKTVAVTLHDLGRFDPILRGALARGATHVLDVTFRTSALRMHRDQARDRAVRAAQEKALALATALGAKLGPVQTITENVWGGWYSAAGGAGWSRFQRGAMPYAQNVQMDAGGGGEDEGTIAPGRIKVTATVGVTFALE